MSDMSMGEQPTLPGMDGASLRGMEGPVGQPRPQRPRTAAGVLFAVAGVVAVLGFLLALAVTHGHGAGAGCRGTPDRLAAEQITYRSDDGVHWTATYPCTGGGSTTRPIAKSAVPGEGA